MLYCSDPHAHLVLEMHNISPVISVSHLQVSVFVTVNLVIFNRKLSFNPMGQIVVIQLSMFRCLVHVTYGLVGESVGGIMSDSLAVVSSIPGSGNAKKSHSVEETNTR